jgi:hypothetical protein
LIIVAPAECRKIAGSAIAKNHHVFLSADAKSVGFNNNIFQLSRPFRGAVEESLKANGL